ncbi:MAG: hypothetical protein RL331_952 [Bacteroidota bacterium]|jgi:hypothetical protein
MPTTTMKKVLFLLVLNVFTLQLHGQNNFMPQQFLGYNIGEQFTRQHRVVDYFFALEKAFPNNIKVVKTGQTYEKRDLLLCYIGTPENLKKLEEIRQKHLTQAPDEKLAIVWLSYNVHGNESSGTEAAMQTAYRLLTDKIGYLENTVVIMDPCLNPDGRDRYVNFYYQYGANPIDMQRFSASHNETWPGGRPNHYLFDLNRDWAWMTQIESSIRMQQYNLWLPHVHVDFHEQGINEPYYFPPAAAPYHEVITNWQREFQQEIGKNHAGYFDKAGWLYFSKEIFDLLYPSYGDTYPTYSGSIGMTYEQGGSGRAGLAVITQVGDTLKLSDRVAHHVTTGLSTVETSARNADKLVAEYQKFRKQKDFKYDSYVIKGSNNQIQPLLGLLGKNNINWQMVSTSTQAVPAKGFHFKTGAQEAFKLEIGDIVVSTQQEKGTLVSVLFEPRTKLSDSLTYDITAWSVPYAYGLDAYAVEGQLKATPFAATGERKTDFLATEGFMGYAVRWETMQTARFLNAVQQAGLKVYFHEKGFKLNGQTYAPGTLLLLTGENQRPDFHKMVNDYAARYQVDIKGLLTGMVDQGPDFGSSSVKMVPNPRVGILAGDSFSSLNVGEIWHFFEQQLNKAAHLIFEDDLNGALSSLDVLFVPEGGYDIAGNEALTNWVRAGGTLIVTGGAVDALADQPGFGLKSKESAAGAPSPIAYANQERDQISDNIIGAIYPCVLDNSNPMAFGYNFYYTLRQGASVYELEGKPVFELEKNAQAVNGFVGARVKKQQSEADIAGTVQYGRGTIVYLIDNPLFRGFWESGKLMVVNSIYFVNQ